MQDDTRTGVFARLPARRRASVAAC